MKTYVPDCVSHHARLLSGHCFAFDRRFERGHSSTCIYFVSLFHLGNQQQEIGNYLARLSSEEQPIITIIYHRGETSCVCALPLYTVDLILSTKN
eukprot:scaffold24390_cov144-Skeletonema_menzelii.AAC.10